MQDLAQALYNWVQAATPAQQAEWLELSEPYNAMLWDSPYAAAYESLSEDDQWGFWSILDDMFVGE